jgi:hypothetical protein
MPPAVAAGWEFRRKRGWKRRETQSREEENADHEELDKAMEATPVLRGIPKRAPAER